MQRTTWRLYELSILVRFKLFTYYHSITRQTKWINLNKLITQNMAIMRKIWKLGFPRTVRLKNTFSNSSNSFKHQTLAYSSIIKPVTVKVWKTFPKRMLIRKLDFCIKKYFFPNQLKNLSPFHIDVPIRSHALRTIGTGPTRNTEIMRPVRTLVLVSKG